MTNKELLYKLATEDLPEEPFGLALEQFHGMYPKREELRLSYAEILHSCIQVFCNGLAHELAMERRNEIAKMQRYFDIHVQNQMDWKGRHANDDCPLGSGLSCEYADKLRELKDYDEHIDS